MIVRPSAAGQGVLTLDLRDATGALRIGLLADTHGVLDAGVAARLTGCDLVLHAGDVGAVEVLDELRRIAGRVLAVRGNNDTQQKWRVRDGRPMPDLPGLVRVRLPGGDLVVEHGDAHAARTRHARLRAAHPAARAVVYGHSHRLLAQREQLPWILNPGAAGRARTYGGPSCLLLGVRGEHWRLSVHRHPVGAPARR